MESLLPAAVVMSTCIIAAAWCMNQGSTINASYLIERRDTSIWGTLLHLIGGCLMFVAFLIVPLLLIERVSLLTMFFLNAITLFILVLIVSKSSAGKESVNGELSRESMIGTVIMILIVSTSILFFSPSFGGDYEVIPEGIWNPLLGAMVMIAALVASSLAIMAAVKAGGEMLQTNENLSIWSLLFVALGEGLAIYGLIVAILLIGG